MLVGLPVFVSFEGVQMKIRVIGVERVGLVCFEVSIRWRGMVEV